MCGIAGIVRFDEAPVEASLLSAACRAQRHRGPDHAGIWIEDGGARVGLGAVRLAVQDPRPQADQPFQDPSGRFVLVYNGELYNGFALRAELEATGWAFRTTGDTEVVLASCATWGSEAFARFDGMWGLAFYDRRERRGFLSRDAFGIKPLVYAADASSLKFASELGGLAALGSCRGGVDPEALLHHLAFGFVAHPRTIYADTRRLPPGHVLSFTDRGAEAPRRWFHLGEEIARRRETWACAGYGEACARLRELIRAAVVRQRVSDVPLGCFLSGGVDSSIVALHLSEASSRPVRTYSIGYAEHGSYDETRHAEAVAQHLGTEHVSWRLTTKDVAAVLPEVLDHAPEPFADSSIVPTTLVCRLARRETTVALSGDGADELFGGYWRYLAHAALRGYRRLPGFLRRRVIEPVLLHQASSKGAAGADRVRQWRKLIRADSDDVIENHLAWARILSPEAEEILSDTERLRAIVSGIVRQAKADFGGLTDGGDAAAAQAFDVQYGLPCDMLHKVDQASMSCSLEVRVPFLDVEAAAGALAMPSTWKVDRGMRKRILVDAYRGRLPDSALDRPKRGFEAPFGELVRGRLLGMFRDVVTRERVEATGMLRYSGVEAVLSSHLNRTGEHGDLLFALLALCWWIHRADRRR